MWLTFDRELVFCCRKFSNRKIIVTVENKLDLLFNLDETIETVQERVKEYMVKVEDEF